MNSGRPPTDPKKLRWRSDLLSSSLPLEFRVARLAVARGYRVVADYSYSRNLAGIEKEMSIDILASRDVPAVDSDGPGYAYRANIFVPIECKYRRPGVSWLFLPEVNDPTKPALIIPTLRSLTYFSSYRNVDGYSNLSLARCYKGVEIDLESGSSQRVTDQELRHGFDQLQFALVPILRSIVNDALSSIDWFPEATVPAFVVPILVTNAPIYVASSKFDEIDIASITSLDDISRPVPALSMELSCGPQLQSEVRREFSDVRETHADEIEKLNALQRGADISGQASASFTLNALERATDYVLRQLFSSIVVCSVSELENLLSRYDHLVERKTSISELLR